VNGDADAYDCFVYTTDRLLPCEEVAKAVEQLTQAPIYQEALTQQLADRLRAKVKTVGRHTAGNIETTVVCHPKGGA
jgi:GTP cyclohydrolase I